MTKSLIQKTILLADETDTQALATKLASLSITGSVWLSGDLGAGKTTLTRYWLRALGHQGAVKSPTYTLVEPYQILQTDEQGNTTAHAVYHADLYRLQDPEELEFIGFNEYLEEESALMIIEWASRAEDYLPTPVLTIDIHTQENDTREVCISLVNSLENNNNALLQQQLESL